MFPTRNNHHDRSAATLAQLWCVQEASSVNWNLVWTSLFSFGLDIDPSPARWKCGNPASLFLAGFPSPVESVGNSLWFLEFSRLSTGRHFHGAFHGFVLGAQRRRKQPASQGSSFLSPGQNLRFPHRYLAPECPGDNDLTSLDPFFRLVRPPSRCVSCASIRPASRGGERCAPAGRGRCRPRSDRQSAHASGRRGPDW
jgi:hypothetical protein